MTTAFAIAVGFAGLLLLAGHILRSEKYFKMNAVYINHAGHLSIYKTDSLDNGFSKPKSYGIDKDDQGKIEKLLNGDQRIEFIGKYLKGSGLVSNGCRSIPFFAMGAEPEVESRIRNHPLVEKWASELAGFIKGRGFWTPGFLPESIAVSKGLSQLLGKPLVYDEVQTKNIDNNGFIDCAASGAIDKIRSDSNVQLATRNYDGDFSAVNAEIVSHYSTGLALTDDNAMLVPLPLLQQLFSTDKITYMAAYLKDGVNHKAMVREIQNKFNDLNMPYVIYPFDNDQISLFYVGAMSFFKTMAVFFIFLVFGVVALTIANSVTMTIIERTREIGTLRSMGFLPSSITNLFICENLVLTSMALIAGEFLAWILSEAIGHGHFTYRPPGVAGEVILAPLLTWESCSIFAVIILCIAILATWITATGRTNQPVVDLLTSTSA